MMLFCLRALFCPSLFKIYNNTNTNVRLFQEDSAQCLTNQAAFLSDWQQQALFPALCELQAPFLLILSGGSFPSPALLPHIQELNPLQISWLSPHATLCYLELYLANTSCLGFLYSQLCLLNPKLHGCLASPEGLLPSSGLVDFFRNHLRNRSWKEASRSIVLSSEELVDML